MLHARKILKMIHSPLAPLTRNAHVIVGIAVLVICVPSNCIGVPTEQNVAFLTYDSVILQLVESQCDAGTTMHVLEQHPQVAFFHLSYVSDISRCCGFVFLLYTVKFACPA